MVSAAHALACGTRGGLVAFRAKEYGFWAWGLTSPHTDVGFLLWVPEFCAKDGIVWGLGLPRFEDVRVLRFRGSTVPGLPEFRSILVPDLSCFRFSADFGLTGKGEYREESFSNLRLDP